MELSIIIPVYNTNEEKLINCLKPVLELDDIDYEILIIDDGSSLEKQKIYDKLIKELNSKLIKYTYKENGGVSSARNFGIGQAMGQYIMFVDSDDILYANEIKREHLYLNQDIIFYNKIVHTETGQVYKKKEIDRNLGEVESIYVIEQILKDSNTFHGPWAKIIRREFLKKHDIKFNESMIQGEDVVFNIEMLKNCPKLYYVDRYVYGYYLDFQTANRRAEKFPMKMFENLKFVYFKKKQTIQDLEFGEKNDKTCELKNYYLSKVFSLCMNFCENKDEDIEILNNISNYIVELKNEKMKAVSKIKFYMIKKQMWFFIKILSKLRKFYFKYLKRNYN